MTLTRILASLLPWNSISKPARLLLLAILLDGVIYSAWSLFFNFFILARGYDKDFLGLVNSLPYIAALLLSIPAGMVSDRIGRRKAMLFGLAINTAAMALQVTVRQPVLLMVMVFIGGVGQQLYLISQAPFMVSASDEKVRATLFSLSFGVVTLSGAAGALFAGQLPQLFSGLLRVQSDSAAAYQAVLLVAVALGSFSMLPIYLIKEPAGSRAVKPHERPPVIQVFRNPVLWKLALPVALIGLGAAVLIPYMNIFFAERFRFSDQRLGLLFSLSSLLTGIGCVIGPRLAHHWKSKIRTVVSTQALSLLFLILLALSPLGWLAGLSFLARGTLMNMANPLYTAFSMERFRPEDQGAANSVINTVWTAGWAVGPYLSGLVQLRFGFQPLFLATTLLYGLSTSLVWLFFRKMERQPDLVEVELALPNPSGING